MHVVITGGAGFLGGRLARHLLAGGALCDSTGRPHAVSSLTLLDTAMPAAPIADPRVRTLMGDLTDPRVVAEAVTPDTRSIFHLAAVVSAQAEADFDLGMRVNLDGTRLLLEHCRSLAQPPRVVFASSLAVFGGPLPDPVPDDARLVPQSSYGTQKAIGELLVHDMTRKGFLDGRSLRLPTVTVRPGRPNQAASSFASGIVREPLAGEEAICPVAPTTRMWVTSPRTVIRNIVVGHDAPAAAFGAARSVNLPGLCVSVKAMVDALRSVAGDAVAERVRWQFDPAIDRIVSTWPARFDARLGASLGMTADADFESIVRAYVEDRKEAAPGRA
jgi:nucleoside-diphosphate-sugar epimerase